MLKIVIKPLRYHCEDYIVISYTKFDGLEAPYRNKATIVTSEIVVKQLYCTKTAPHMKNLVTR